MTGANSAMLTPPSASPNSVLSTDGTTKATVSYSSLTLQTPVFELFGTRRPRTTESNATASFSLDFSDEEGEDLDSFWKALTHSSWACEEIQSFARTLVCPLLDQLTPDDLMEWLFPDEAVQLRQYIEEQEVEP